MIFVIHIVQYEIQSYRTKCYFLLVTENKISFVPACLDEQDEHVNLKKDHARIDNEYMSLLDEFDDLKKKHDELEKINDEFERDAKILIDENIHSEHLLNIEIIDRLYEKIDRPKYGLIYPEPPIEEPIFFTNASFRALFHEDKAAGGEYLEGEREAAPEPALNPGQNTYQEMIHRFDTMEAHFDQHFDQIEFHMKAQDDQVSNICKIVNVVKDKLSFIEGSVSHNQIDNNGQQRSHDKVNCKLTSSQDECIGHLIGDCRPHLSDAPPTGFTNTSNPVNVDVSGDGNTVGVLDNLDIPAIPFLLTPPPIINGEKNVEFCGKNDEVVKLGPTIANAEFVVEEEAAPLGVVDQLPLGSHVDGEEGAVDLPLTIAGDNREGVNWPMRFIPFLWLPGVWGGGGGGVGAVSASPIAVGDELDSGGLGDDFVEPPLDSIELPLLNVPLVDVPVALISNDAMLAHMAVNLEGSGVDHNDWFDGSISLLVGVMGMIWMDRRMMNMQCIT
ncbi:hypothetical protein M5K25_006309 [Dendrobium thyrsiflorum]|uniref:Uncharacterized protein n=1 Tax=Dendrobium thyrsiflorum TaxID=117978 RepID=A0ABD0VIH5_DENTH